MHTELFTLSIPDHIQHIRLNDEDIHVDELNTEKAVLMWTQGAPLVHITKQGAQHCFKGLSPAQLCELMRKAKTLNEVTAILAVRPNSRNVRNAAQERRAQIRGRQRIGLVLDR